MLHGVRSSMAEKCFCNVIRMIVMFHGQAKVSIIVMLHGQTKHVDVQCHFIRELVSCETATCGILSFRRERIKKLF